MVRTALTRWLYAPPVTGWVALIFGLVAVWVPSVIRLAVNGVVTGCEFTPYLPFVLICAIILDRSAWSSGRGRGAGRLRIGRGARRVVRGIAGIPDVML